MILLLHPRSTKPKDRRFPLSILAIAAMLEEREDYRIIDGNLDADPEAALDDAMREPPVELLAVSVMPGPQMVEAVRLCRAFRKKYPSVPIVWGGYFPSLYPDATLNCGYVDFAIRGQGEHTFLELLAALRAGGGGSRIQGLSFKDDGEIVHNPERRFLPPDDFPWYPYHRIDVASYLLPTFLGRRTGVHHASIGCPYRCNFCGVIPAYGSIEKMESPARTEQILRYLKHQYGMDAVQFYDNNFFVGEDHAREQAERLAPLGLRWWSEGRVDALLRFSDDTLTKLKRAGATVIFFGAESGSDWVLEQMNKQLKAGQTLELAKRLRQFKIAPEFSFVIGNPHDPERDIRENLAFIRRIKRINPDAEIIVQHYIPTPQREAMYGYVDGRIQFPTTPDEWATPRWLNFTLRNDPQVPWLPKHLKAQIDNFELVVSSRWPTIQDIRMPRWGRWMLKALSSWRYSFGVYDNPVELEWAQRFVRLRKPRLESL